MSKSFQKQKIAQTQIIKYESSLNCRLITTRFNNNTFRENKSFCTKHKFACAYFSPIPLSDRIALNTICFILEMNNEKNELSGIGVLRNIPQMFKYDAYTDRNYNRVAYIGNYHVTREDIIADEESNNFWQYLECLCFKGKGHLKRGQGFTCFPLSILMNSKERIDILQKIIQIVKRKFQIQG